MRILLTCFIDNYFITDFLKGLILIYSTMDIAKGATVKTEMRKKER